jgi:LCP family protein required for cell wall assembly
MASRRRTRHVSTAIALLVGTATVLGVGLGLQTSARLDSIRRVEAVSGALQPVGPVVENYLLVGSDSREGADPNDPDFAGIGDAGQTTGRRSDTIMVLRVDRTTGDVALLSLPRDLWVDVAGTGESNRINSAYTRGPEVLVETVQNALGIPINHYVEVDFQGFKSIIDAIGGVEVCFADAARDEHTGLAIPGPGCHVLDGVTGLQYARSRYYEEFRDGDWQIDGTADIGRTKRQQAFVEAMMRTAVDATAANPFRAGALVEAATGALSVDPQLDIVRMARQLRPAATGGVRRFSLPVRGTEIDGKSVLLLEDSTALPIIAYFQGGGPAPEAAG